MSATVRADAGVRSYKLLISTSGVTRRNRCQLRKLPNSEEQSNDVANDESSSQTVEVTPHSTELLPVTTSSGRVVKPPQKFQNEL